MHLIWVASTNTCCRYTHEFSCCTRVCTIGKVNYFAYYTVNVHTHFNKHNYHTKPSVYYLSSYVGHSLPYLLIVVVDMLVIYFYAAVFDVALCQICSGRLRILYVMEVLGFLFCSFFYGICSVWLMSERANEHSSEHASRWEEWVNVGVIGVDIGRMEGIWVKVRIRSRASDWVVTQQNLPRSRCHEECHHT